MGGEEKEQGSVRKILKKALEAGAIGAKNLGGKAKEALKKADEFLIEKSLETGLPLHPMMAIAERKRSESRWGPDVSPDLETPVLPQRDSSSKPSICLSDLGEYKRTISLPTETTTLKEEGEAVTIYDPKKMNTDQAIRATLEWLNDLVLLERPVASYEHRVTRHYINRIKEELGSNHSIPVTLDNLNNTIFNFQKLLYNVWRLEKGGMGGKHHGALEMINGVNSIDSKTSWQLLQDPHIAAAMMRIKGNISDKDFSTGRTKRTDATGNDLGTVYGGEIGGAEKIGYYLRMWTGLGGHDEPGQVAGASYTEYVLNHPRNYFGDKPNLYRAWKTYIEGPRYRSTDKKKEVMFVWDTLPPPSAFHQRSMRNFLWDNFESQAGEKMQRKETAFKNFGWQNIGRMLALLEGGEWRDSRWAQSGKDMGVYTLEQFLLADEDTQQEMANHAWDIYVDLPKNIQNIILSVNAYRTYYLREGKGGFVKKLVLDFNQSWKDKNEIIHDYVDIGSLKQGKWLNQTGNFLNTHWTDFEYAYRTQDDIFDSLCQTDPQSASERVKAVLNTLGAKEGWRHLGEKVEDREQLRSLGYERQRSIMNIFDIFSESIHMTTWDNRRHGRERLPWALDINRYISLGYDMRRFLAEFESVGIYGRDWSNLHVAEMQLTPQEKMAKILGRLDRPEVWRVYLRNIGLPKQIRNSLETIIPQGQRIIPAEWQAVGFRDYWDYLAYNAIAAFAGFKAKETRTEEDFYGNQFSRVLFELDFTRPEERGVEGNSFKDLLPVSVGENKANETWDGMIKLLLGTEGGRAGFSGELTETTFSRFLEFYEKMQEESIVDNMIEIYLQETFDKNLKDNWVENRWTKNLLYKKRWDTWALIRRQMKYSVGALAKEDWWVHDQIKIDEDRKIVVDEKGIPSIESGRMGWDRVASESLGTVGVWRPPEGKMTAMKNPRSEREKNYRRKTGMGDADEEKQLSWMPIYYDKYMVLNFLEGRFLDSAYSIESSENGNTNWELNLVYLRIVDPEQKEEFFDAVRDFLPEDVGWVNGLKEKHGVDPLKLIEFKKAKSSLLIRDIKGKTEEGATEDEIVNFQKIIPVVSKIPGFPILRSAEEAKSFAIGALATGVVSVSAASAIGVFSTIGGVIIGVPLTLIALPIYGGTRLIDKGVYENGREKALGTIAEFLGGDYGGFALGMVGKRIRARKKDVIAKGFEPVWDSAINMEGLFKQFAEYRKQLRPAPLVRLS